jgi:uncharacterized membrane protein YgdD (TMEM256/DUF423 family)
MNRKIIATGAFFGFSAVILGALGAHALKSVLNADQLASFETGVRFQMYHAFFLLFLGLAAGMPGKVRMWIYGLVVSGTVFFSGSIYLLTTAGLNDSAKKVIGPITPLGGALLMVAWILLFVDFLRKKS